MDSHLKNASSSDHGAIAFEGIVKDYEYLIKEFGIQPLTYLLPRISKPHMYMRRGVMFGHVDLERILEAMDAGEKFAVMTGIKPTGTYHIGSFTTCEEVIYFQKMGGYVFFCVADMEAYAVNGIPLKEGAEIAVDNLADFLALGFDPKLAYVYRQSESKNVLRLGSIFASHVTQRTMEAIYGKHPFGLYMSALIQAGDILQPQLEEFNGPKPTVVPIGADQAPHSRLTRDLAGKQEFRREFGFIAPSFTFHTLIRGLDGSEKMAKREPLSYFTLDEDEDAIAHKVKNAFTGGRENAKQQRLLGGRPEICRIYELSKYFFIREDRELRSLYQDCKNGNLLCGPCKQKLLEKVLVFRKDHIKRKRQNLSLAQKIMKETTA